MEWVAAYKEFRVRFMLHTQIKPWASMGFSSECEHCSLFFSCMTTTWTDLIQKQEIGGCNFWSLNVDIALCSSLFAHMLTRSAEQLSSEEVHVNIQSLKVVSSSSEVSEHVCTCTIASLVWGFPGLPRLAQISYCQLISYLTCLFNYCPVWCTSLQRKVYLLQLWSSAQE